MGKAPKDKRKKRTHRNIRDSTGPGAREGFEWRAGRKRGPGEQAHPEMATRGRLHFGEDKAVQGRMWELALPQLI